MAGVLRSVRKRKKNRRLGEVDIVRREDYAEVGVDSKMELIPSLVPLGLMHVPELLDESVEALAGARYARKEERRGGWRYESNPGSVRMAGQRVLIRVPRVRQVNGTKIALRSYEALYTGGEVDERLRERVLYEISCRNYERAAEAMPGDRVVELYGIARLHRGKREQAARAAGAGLGG